MYNMTEFKKNIRKAFEDANQGHEVVIKRYGQKFQLVSLVDLPLPSPNKGLNKFIHNTDEIIYEPLEPSA